MPSELPFKAYCTNKYDERLASDGINQETDCGNLKPPPRREIVRWILESWEQLPVEVIRNSFYACGISVATDGSKDEKITCFKPDSPCSAGREMLKAQLPLLECQKDNPFITDEMDAQEAHPDFMILEEDISEE